MRLGNKLCNWRQPLTLKVVPSSSVFGRFCKYIDLTDICTGGRNWSEYILVSMHKGKFYLNNYGDGGFKNNGYMLHRCLAQM